MTPEQCDAELQLAMRRILAFARKEIPTSIFCIMSFTQVDVEGTIYSANKIATNVGNREALAQICTELLDNFLQAEVEDYRGETIN